MINDEVSIYNLALNAIGARSNVVSPTEKSREAEVCRLWYSVVRDQVLVAAPWPSSSTLARLAQLAEGTEDDWVPTAPAPGFQFAYAAPSDMLRPQYITTYASFELMAWGATGQAIMTNESQAILRYTKRQTVIQVWDAELQMAIVQALAAHICLPLSGKTNRAKNMIDQANALILNARIGAANTNATMYETIPDWIQLRGYGGVFPSQHFVYPFGSLLTTTAINVL